MGSPSLIASLVFVLMVPMYFLLNTGHHAETGYKSSLVNDSKISVKMVTLDEIAPLSDELIEQHKTKQTHQF